MVSMSGVGLRICQGHPKAVALAWLPKVSELAGKDCQPSAFGLTARAAATNGSVDIAPELVTKGTLWAKYLCSGGTDDLRNFGAVGHKESYGCFCQ